MSGIYDVEGRRFRDALENLCKARKTHASQWMQLRSNASEVVA